jgi:hypothetical protein
MNETVDIKIEAEAVELTEAELSQVAGSALAGGDLILSALAGEGKRATIDL